MKHDKCLYSEQTNDDFYASCSYIFICTNKENNYLLHAYIIYFLNKLKSLHFSLPNSHFQNNIIFLLFQNTIRALRISKDTLNFEVKI